MTWKRILLHWSFVRVIHWSAGGFPSQKENKRELWCFMCLRAGNLKRHDYHIMPQYWKEGHSHSRS